MKFKVNTKIYPLEAILSTAYLFVDRAYIYLVSKGEDCVEVSLKGKKKLSEKKLNALKGEFFNELLNSALRIKVAKRNKDIRTFIVQQALFSAMSKSPSDLSEEAEEAEADYKEDPLGIAVPWEETHKDNG